MLARWPDVTTCAIGTDYCNLCDAGELALGILQPFESTQGIPVVSQGRVARAKVAAALAAGACRGGNCPMRTLFFWCVSA